MELAGKIQIRILNGVKPFQILVFLHVLPVPAARVSTLVSLIIVLHILLFF